MVDDPKHQIDRIETAVRTIRVAVAYDVIRVAVSI